MPNAHTPRVLVYYAAESSAHMRGVQNLLDGLRKAGLTSVRATPDTEIDATTLQAGDFDWLLIIWSPTIASRLASDAALKESVDFVRHAFLVIDPPKRFTLPPLFERALHMLLGDVSDILLLADRLLARPKMSEPPLEESAPPPPAPSADDARDSASGAAAPDPGVVFPVWFGTNRKPDGQGGYTGERYNKTTYGSVNVFVPEGHRFGETGSSFWKKLIRFDLRDDTLRIQDILSLDHDALFAALRAASQGAADAGDEPHALLFIHGYKVSFDEAAIRAAQIGFDLKVSGPTAFFSWPSRGELKAYTADEASIEASEPAITEFLVDFASSSGARKVHIIAHSMGNRGLLRALQRIAGNAETRGKVTFDQIILAAPDIDRDVFMHLAHLYPEHAGRTTLYASNGDLAVYLSDKLHDAPRAGYFEPYTVVPGIDTVAVPDFDVDALGHSYFSRAEPLLYDMNRLMRYNEAPDDRPRLQSAQSGGLAFWRMTL
jgi:esterase/lipase superfamily enzyme